jgi:indole-3-glycerol phosphate synthase
VHEAAALGADAILLIVAALTDPELRSLHEAASSVGLAALVEVHEAGELRRALGAGARIIGVNSRNLRTLDVDLGVLERLAGEIPKEVVKVAESGIRTADDIRRLSQLGYDAFLVGERLMTREDPGAALRELRTR